MPVLLPEKEGHFKAMWAVTSPSLSDFGEARRHSRVVDVEGDYTCTIWFCQGFAMENGHRNSEVSVLRMMIFRSYINVY